LEDAGETNSPRRRKPLKMMAAATAGLPVMENEGTIAAARSIVEPMKHRQWLAGRWAEQCFKLKMFGNCRTLRGAPWTGGERGGKSGNDKR